MSFACTGVRVAKYDKYILHESVAMSVACSQGDAIHIKTDGTGELADAADNTKPAQGFASRAVSAADVTAGGNRAKATLYSKCILADSTGGTKGGLVYLKASSSAGATLTQTLPAATNNLDQVLGVVSADGTSIVAQAVPSLVVHA